MALKQLKDTTVAVAHEQPTLLAKTQRAYRSIQDEIRDVNVSRFAADTKTWMVDHPYQTGGYIASGILLVRPGLVTVPALRMAGFTAEGIADGSAAAAIHSLFETLQSAGAAGSGLPAVNEYVQGAVTGLQTFNLGSKLFGRIASRIEVAGNGSEEDQEAEEANAGDLDAKFRNARYIGDIESLTYIKTSQ